MKEFTVVVAGTVMARTETKQEAEKILQNLKNSFLRMVHPIDTFYIKEVSK